MFFDNWGALGRVVIVGILAYSGLILLLRVSGKRTLSQMKAFDLLVTVALGASLATILFAKDVDLARGMTAFIVLTPCNALSPGSRCVFPWSIAWSSRNRRCYYTTVAI